MNIALICAMDFELIKIKEAGNLQQIHSIRGREITEVNYGRHTLYMGVCGVGKVNAANFTQLLMDHFPVELIVNTGIAGSLSEELGMLSMVVGTDIYYHDLPQDILEETYPFRPYFETSSALVNMALAGIPQGVHSKAGAIATGDDFIDSEEKKLRIISRTKAIACDMESVAVAQTAFSAKKDFLILRAISDTADESYTGIYEDFKHQATDISVQTFLGFLEHLQ